MTIAEAQAQVTAAESQLAQQRAKAQTAQEKSTQQLRQIQTAQEKLPSHTSQSALRQKMAGIAGMIKRKAIAKVKTALTGKKGQVQEYQKGIEEYKQALTKYELEKIAPVKAQIKQAQEYDAAVERVQSAADKGKVGLLAIYGEGLVKKLAQRYVKQQSIAREELKTQVSTFETTHPGEKLVVDWKQLKVKGIESGSLGQTLSLKEYNKKVKQFKPEKIQIEEFKEEIIQPTTLPGITNQQLTKPTFFQKVGDVITKSGIPLVSALPSDDTGLKRFIPSKVNDTSVSNRILHRIPSGISKVQPIRDRIDTFISDLSKGTKKGEEKAKVFSTTGSVVSAYDPTEYKPTYIPKKTFAQKITSIPSIGLASAREFSEKQAGLVSAEALLGVGKVGAIAGKEIVGTMQVAERVKISSGVKTDIKNLDSKISNFDKSISNLEKGNINKMDQWTGTNTDYNKYIKAYEQREKLSNKRENLYNKYQRTSIIRIGPRDRDVMEFRGLTRNPLTAVGSSIKLGGAIVGGATGVATKKTLDYFGFKPIIKPEKKINIFTEQYGTIQRDLLKGEEIPFYKKDITIIPKKVITSKDIGVGVSKVTEAGIGFGKYLIPGGGLFMGTEAGAWGADVAQTKLIDDGKLTREQKIEGVFTAATLFGLGTLKGARIIKNKAIQKAITKGIKVLEKQPIKSLTSIDEGSGIIYAEGIRSIKGVDQTVKYYGKIRQTEKGNKIIPSGEGVIETAGKVQPKVLGVELKPRKFISGTEFEFGSKGKDLYLGKIGEAKVFEELGLSTAISKKDYFGITKEFGKEGTTELTRQLRKGVISDPLAIKDITAPIGQRSMYVKLTDPLGLRVSPQEIGTVITIPKKIKVDPLGFKGAGKPSSEKFFKNLYTPQIEKPVSKLSIPQISQITAKIKPKIPKIISKSTLDTTVPSAYTGLGLYEKTDSVLTPLSLKADTKPALVERDVLSFQPKVGVGLKHSIFQTPKQREILSIKPMTDLRISQKPTTGVLQSPRIKTDLRISQATRTKQVTKQIQRPFQITTQRIIPKVTTKMKPKLIILPLIKPEKEKRPLRLPKRGEEEIFFGITKRYGKEVIVARARTAKEAEMITKKDVLGTLGATVKVRTKAGRQVQLAGDKTFRLSKVDPLALVQKKTRRLAAIGERIEIKQARKGKIKKKVTKKRFSLK